MRTYGRVPVAIGSIGQFAIGIGGIGESQVSSDSGYVWVEVGTTASGDNSRVYLTTLIQCLKLNINESPFYANYGIPAQRSVVTQVFPDYYVMQTQRQFAAFFASLIISKITDPEPKYRVNVTFMNGAPQLPIEVAV